MRNATRIARARMRYTGEPLGNALAYLREYRLEHGIVPAAASMDQQAFEAAVLHTLATVIGEHQPERLAVYGIAEVSPTPGTIRIVLDDSRSGEFAQALLAGGASGGGLPALRTERSKNGRVELHWPGGGILTVVSRDFAKAADQARRLQRDVSAAEQVQADQLRVQLAPNAPRISTTLRRLGLFLSDDSVDFRARYPTDDRLGSDDPLHKARIVPAESLAAYKVPVIAFASRGGGAGSTTLAMGVVAGLALRGHRVAVLDGRQWPDLSDHYQGARWDEDPRALDWGRLPRTETGGAIAAVDISSPEGHPATSAQLRAAIRMARNLATVIVVDAPVSEVFDELVDRIVYPVAGVSFSVNVSQDDRSPRVLLHTWLLHQYSTWHNCPLDLAPPLTNESARQRFIGSVESFLTAIAMEAQQRWPHQWAPETRQEWISAVHREWLEDSADYDGQEDGEDEEEDGEGIEDDLIAWLDDEFRMRGMCPIHLLDTNLGRKPVTATPADLDRRRKLLTIDVARFAEAIGAEALHRYPDAWSSGTVRELTEHLCRVDLPTADGDYDDEGSAGFLRETDGSTGYTSIIKSVSPAQVAAGMVDEARSRMPATLASKVLFAINNNSFPIGDDDAQAMADTADAVAAHGMTLAAKHIPKSVRLPQMFIPDALAGGFLNLLSDNDTSVAVALWSLIDDLAIPEPPPQLSAKELIQPARQEPSPQGDSDV